MFFTVLSDIIKRNICILDEGSKNEDINYRRVVHISYNEQDKKNLNIPHTYSTLKGQLIKYWLVIVLYTWRDYKHKSVRLGI